MGFFIGNFKNKIFGGGYSPLKQQIKRTLANETILLPKNKRKESLENINNSSFMNWNDYSMFVKKIMYEQYHFNFQKYWNNDKENQLYDYFKKRINIEDAVKYLIE